MDIGLAIIFLDARRADAETPTVELEEALRAALAEGIAAWPQLPPMKEAFVRHLAARIPATAPSLPAAVAAVNAADLYLACACTLRTPKAIEDFDAEFLRPLPGQVRLSRKDDGKDDDDLLQLLREQLLTGVPPGIADYSGAGSLRRYIQVAARRRWLSMRRSMDAHVEERGLRNLSDALRASGDLDLEYLRRHTLPVIEAAIQAACALLSEPQQCLLHLYYVRKLTERRLAELQGKSQSTLHRELAAAQRALESEVRRQCGLRLRLSNSSLDRLVDQIRSRLDLHLSQLLPDPKKRKN